MREMTADLLTTAAELAASEGGFTAVEFLTRNGVSVEDALANLTDLQVISELLRNDKPCDNDE